MEINESIEIVKLAFDNREYPVKPEDEAKEAEALAIAIKAMKKQDPMKPVKEIFGNYDCPVCNAYVEFSGNQSYYKHGYCPNCGQAIDWNEGEEE